ncbi:TetR/AcrR family transcriptional regulator [Gemmatimonadota bacterium]
MQRSGRMRGRQGDGDTGSGDTRSRILEAATTHFAEKGYEGARTQAIADDAGVNRAMLYYHFKDKEHLYREMLTGHFQVIFSQVFPTFVRPDLDSRDRVLKVVDAYIGFLRKNPQIRSLMLYELAAGGPHLSHVVQTLLASIPGVDVEHVFTQIGTMMGRGDVQQGDPRQLFLHILSLTIFPFAARPLLETIWQLGPGEYDALMADRVEAIADLFDHGLFTSKEAQ